MIDSIIDEHADAWGIDRDKLREAAEACVVVIGRIIPDHPSCRDLHVSSLIVAMALDRIEKHAAPGNPLVGTLLAVAALQNFNRDVVTILGVK